MPERFLAAGTDEVEIALVHRSGRMVRFRPSLRNFLPAKPRDVRLTLPDGTEVPGRFNPNPANPNITGAQLVAWIRRVVPTDRTRPARLVETLDGPRIALAGPTIADVREEKLLPPTLVSRVRSMRQREGRVRRKRSYTVWERDPGLRAAILERWEPRCQIDGCPVADMLPSAVQAAVIEVHHLTHVSEGGSDDPLNLTLLCAAHHRLLHHDGPSEVEELPDGDVIIRVGDVELFVRRDIEALIA